MGKKVRLGPAEEIPIQEFKVYQLEAMDLAVYNVDGKFYGISTYCPHAAANLSRGPLNGTVITCPGHGYRFDIMTGKCLTDPEMALSQFDIEVGEDGDLYAVF